MAPNADNATPSSTPYTSVDQISAAREQLESEIDGYVAPAAYAAGVATIGPSGDVLDVSYPHVNAGEHLYTAAVMAKVVGHASGTASYRITPAQIEEALAIIAPAEAIDIPHPNAAAWRGLLEIAKAPAAGGTRQLVVAFLGDAADSPLDAIDAYLRLHLLSYRAFQPGTINMDGVFGVLTNVVWTNLGPFEVADFELTRLAKKAEGRHVEVRLVDKFPPMLDYVIPSGVRIADGNRVRLGAHLAEGTTVMHEGFCNFNAGTLGSSMVEGRISAGVVVDAGSDVGGGASIMGTLSGGGTEQISIGKDCLLGANSGIGISIGDNCIVEAGLYVTAGTLVSMPDKSIRKGRDLSGATGLLFRRNSLTGEVEALARDGASWKGLNESLHAN